jgi:hypothetical protein
MLRIILLILAIVVLASIAGIDGCACGCGPEIRATIKDTFGSK